METEYYTTVETKKERNGIRFFRFKPHKEKVLQIVLDAGGVKKGKSNSVGMYQIHRITFLSNYLAMKYVIKCTKEDFENARQKILIKLK